MIISAAQEFTYKYRNTDTQGSQMNVCYSWLITIPLHGAWIYFIFFQRNTPISN